MTPEEKLHAMRCNLESGATEAWLSQVSRDGLLMLYIDLLVQFVEVSELTLALQQAPEATRH